MAKYIEVDIEVVRLNIFFLQKLSYHTLRGEVIGLGVHFVCVACTKKNELSQTVVTSGRILLTSTLLS